MFHSDSDGDQFDDGSEIPTSRSSGLGESFAYTSSSSGRSSRLPVDDLHPADMIKPQFDFKGAAGQRLVLPPEETNDEPDDDLEERIHQYMRLKHTVLQVFRNLTIQYNTENIELSPGELLSLCIGIKYISADGKLKTIMSTPAYLQRIDIIMRKCCIESGNGKSGKYRLKPLFGAAGRFSTNNMF